MCHWSVCFFASHRNYSLFMSRNCHLPARIILKTRFPGIFFSDWVFQQAKISSSMNNESFTCWKLNSLWTKYMKTHFSGFFCRRKEIDEVNKQYFPEKKIFMRWATNFPQTIWFLWDNWKIFLQQYDFDAISIIFLINNTIFMR